MAKNIRRVVTGHDAAGKAIVASDSVIAPEKIPHGDAFFAKLAVLESADVATCEVEYHSQPDLHDRYEIAGIPTTVVADGDGVVRAAFVGAFTATDLWAAVAEARAPGSTPEPELGLGQLR